MYEITSEEDIFYADTWEEIKDLWDDIVFAMGAEDATMTIKYVGDKDD